MSFIFGTEISVFRKICKWWWRGGGGKLRRRCSVSSFSNCYFSDKIDQNGVRHSFNFHFSLLISKKRSKNPSLDDSPLLNAPEGSLEMNVSLINSEGFKFHRVINNNTWLLHHIKTYINTISMKFNSLMTLCKHRLCEVGKGYSPSHGRG